MSLLYGRGERRDSQGCFMGIESLVWLILFDGLLSDMMPFPRSSSGFAYGLSGERMLELRIYREWSVYSCVPCSSGTH